MWMVLKFYYNVKLKGIATMKKADMVDKLAKRLVVQPQHARLELPPTGPPVGVVEQV